MRLSTAARGWTCALMSSLFAATLLAGCGSPAAETPTEIPPAPQEASKASFQALSGSKKAVPKPVAR